MTARMVRSAINLGSSRGLIEFRNNLPMVAGYVFLPLLFLVGVWVARERFEANEGGLAAYAIPGILVMSSLFSGLMGIASVIMQERMDGTLIRVRCIPNGAAAYAIGKVVTQLCISLVSFAVLTVAAGVVIGYNDITINNILNVLWIVPAGHLSMLPMGVFAGVIIKTPRQLNIFSLVMTLFASISGVFTPISSLPSMIRWFTWMSPLYWLSDSVRDLFARHVSAQSSAYLGGGWSLATAALVFVTWTAGGAGMSILYLKKGSHLQNGTRVRRRAHLLAMQPDAK